MGRSGRTFFWCALALAAAAAAQDCGRYGAERAALMDVYNSTGGSAWYQSDGWGTDAVCSPTHTHTHTHTQTHAHVAAMLDAKRRPHGTHSQHCQGLQTSNRLRDRPVYLVVRDISARPVTDALAAHDKHEEKQTGKQKPTNTKYTCDTGQTRNRTTTKATQANSTSATRSARGRNNQNKYTNQARW